MVVKPLASSTVTTPSLPTFSTACAIKAPISESPLADMVATCAILSVSSTGSASSFRYDTISSAAWSMPVLISVDEYPLANIFKPSAYIACANVVAVVVPSPATSFVLEATSLTI